MQPLGFVFECEYVCLKSQVVYKWRSVFCVFLCVSIICLYFGSQDTGQRYHSKSQIYYPISITKALAKSIWLTNNLMFGKGYHGYQYVQNTPVKLQYDHSLQHHQCTKVLFMAKLTSRNREHSLACTSWCNDEAKGQLLPITQLGH